MNILKNLKAKISSYIFRVRLKGLLVYILYNIVLLTIAYFLNRFYQMLIFVLFYNMIQNCFHYRFHADTIQENPIKAVRLCKMITIAVEIIYLILCKNLDISLYSNLFIVFVITFTSALLQYCMEYFLIKKDLLRDKEKLLLMCEKAKLSKNATDRMILKYIDNKTYQEIADLECVDVQTIKMSINRSRKKLGIKT